jgi:hypothetical protein
MIRCGTGNVIPMTIPADAVPAAKGEPWTALRAPDVLSTLYAEIVWSRLFKAYKYSRLPAPKSKSDCGRRPAAKGEPGIGDRAPEVAIEKAAIWSDPLSAT